MRKKPLHYDDALPLAKLASLAADGPTAAPVPAPRRGARAAVARKKPRPLGLLDGRFRIPDDLNRPLSKTVLRRFSGA